MVSDEQFSLKGVCSLVEADAALAAEVLRLANSAMFSRRYEVVSILHAVSVLGTDRLKAMVTTIALRDFLSGVSETEVLRRCWRHNLASALVMDRLAQACWLDQPAAYTAGLLHDLGRLALINLDSAKYAAVLDHATDTAGELSAREIEAFGMDSAGAGSYLAETWGFPDALRRAISTHRLAPDPNARDIAALTPTACFWADMLGFPIAGHAPEWQPEALLAAVPGSAAERLAPGLDELSSLLACQINLFECEFSSPSAARPPSPPGNGFRRTRA